MHVLTLFFTIPKLIEKFKNAKIENFRSYFIPTGPNNKRFESLCFIFFFAILGRFMGLPILLLYFK